MRRIRLLTIILLLCPIGCANSYTPKPTLLNLREQTKSPEEVSQDLSEAVSNWFYGPGLGRTVMNVGTSIVFPPYAFYLLGNGALQLFGQEPLHMTEALPEKSREYVLSAYDGITSVPGRVTAGVAGKPYYTQSELPLQTTDASDAVAAHGWKHNASNQ